jgi:hypothetical protein
MLDKPEKTSELMAILEAAAPFKVALMPDLIDHLARQQRAQKTASDISLSKSGFFPSGCARCSAQ